MTQQARVGEAQILICYTGSNDAKRAVDTAPALLGPRHAIVLNVAPAMTFAEGRAATSSLVPGGAFEELNRPEALRRTEAGASRRLERLGARDPRPDYLAGIVDVADELDAAVIVIGSRSLSGAREFARGSLSHDVATHARHPVLIVPPLTEGAD
jgi:nucleotide-binding universal stress UspA family protein